MTSKRVSKRIPKCISKWTESDTRFLLVTVQAFGKHKNIWSYVSKNTGKSAEACRRKHYKLTRDLDSNESNNNSVHDFVDTPLFTIGDIKDVDTLPKVTDKIGECDFEVFA